MKKISSGSRSSGKNMKIVKYLSIVGIVGILLLLSLIGIRYFVDFREDSSEEPPTPAPDYSGIPDSNSTGTMPATEKEEQDADAKTEGNVVAESVSEHRRGGGHHSPKKSDLFFDLQIEDQDEFNYKDGVTATWTMLNMMPGDSVSGWVKFINNGNILSDLLKINCTSVTIDPPGPESDTEEGTTDLDKEMTIAKMIYYYGYRGNKQIDCLSLLNDINGNGKRDLDDLEAQTIDLPPPGMAYAYATNLSMTVQFNPDAGNNYQGDILESTFIFVLTKL